MSDIKIGQMVTVVGSPVNGLRGIVFKIHKSHGKSFVLWTQSNSKKGNILAGQGQWEFTGDLRTISPLQILAEQAE